MSGALRELTPGIALLVVIAIAARVVGSAVPSVDHLLLAIVGGMVMANAVGVPDRAREGVDTYQLWLELGIVLMGTALSIHTVLTLGPWVVVLVFGFSSGTILFVETVARRGFGLPERFGSLLAAGASVCGVSAVVAVAGSIRANERHLAFAVATILLFDVVTLFSFPVVGRFLGLSGVEYGVWIGVSMFSTGPVAAAGFAYSEVAGQWAVFTKLLRNLLLGVVVVGYSVYYAGTSADSDVSVRTVWQSFPKFVIGFLVAMAVANSGVLSEAELATIESVYDWCFLIAFAGVGTHVRARDVRNTSVAPVLVVLCGLLGVSLTSLLVVLSVF